MLKGIFYRLSPPAKLGIATLLIILSFILIYFIGIIVAVSVFHWNIFQSPELLTDFKNPENIKV